MLCTRSSCISYCILVDPRNFTQLKDLRRELEISLFSYLRVFSNLKRGSFDLFISSSIIFPISKYERGNNMTFPKYRKNEDLINRSILVLPEICLHFIRIGKNARFRKLHFRSGEKFILFGSFLGVGENLL